MPEQQTALQKAHSAAHHLARMKKAVADFHDKLTKAHKDHMEKVCALHKAHHDDMQKAIGGLHKILGVEEIGSEYGTDTPTSDASMPGATRNIQDFGPGSTGGPNAAKAVGEVEIEKAVSSALDQFASVLVKALGEPEPQQQNVPGGSQVQAFVQRTVAKSEGVGDRSNLQPLPVTVHPVTKSADTNPAPQQAATEPVTQDTVQKAMQGDLSAQLALMKGAQPAQMPAVLLQELSKVTRH